ncbi:MAG TPA: 50S ribosomal protein L10, partial [Candidatus Paceibacterota bacterium]|nr:50S ribosomal protein L10 [Candidatus Paceibacterota bacterium]
GVADLNGSLTGQIAVITGLKDVSVAAKVVKTFASEFDKLKIKFGFLNNQRLADTDIIALADLPSIEVLRGKLLGVLNAPATKFVTLLNTPASQLARVLQAKADKGQ